MQKLFVAALVGCVAVARAEVRCELEGSYLGATCEQALPVIQQRIRGWAASNGHIDYREGSTQYAGYVMEDTWGCPPWEVFGRTGEDIMVGDTPACRVSVTSHLLSGYFDLCAKRHRLINEFGEAAGLTTLVASPLANHDHCKAFHWDGPGHR
eukprot:TRINITY_DN10609_c0_g1_i1.p2 TRINITY_DN10609_c0_g1~~TRINITY_DN10609_c0_g1_i1.p2  ORF type:complete len:176 (+),score=57.73 TRINITY_DN10609_c0_g1_i1:71-529(+)